MPTSVLVWLGAQGAAQLNPLEQTLSFLNTNLFGNLILVGLNRAIHQRPQDPGAGISSSGRTISIRQPISPWQVVLGQKRIGWDLTFAFQSTDKKYLHFVVTLACHACEEIGDVWLDDQVITSGMLDANGVVSSGKYSRIVPTTHTEFAPASPYTTAFPVASVQAVAVSGANADGETIWIALADVSPAAPGTNQYSLSGSTFTFGPNALGGTPQIDYTESVAVPLCRIKKSLGTETGQPFPDLVAESEGKWTDAHRQTGHTKLYVRFDTSVLTAGAPQISAVLKGAKLYDPRTGLTAWSANPALAVLAYLTSTDFGLGAALGAEIGNAEFIAAANVCDENVALAGFALSLDGISGYVNVPSSAALNVGAGEFAFEFWANIAAFGANGFAGRRSPGATTWWRVLN